MAPQILDMPSTDFHTSIATLLHVTSFKFLLCNQGDGHNLVDNLFLTKYAFHESGLGSRSGSLTTQISHTQAPLISMSDIAVP